jgi:hypothetical protein
MQNILGNLGEFEQTKYIFELSVETLTIYINPPQHRFL